jgi:hypothetical protein
MATPEVVKPVKNPTDLLRDHLITLQEIWKALSPINSDRVKTLES